MKISRPKGKIPSLIGSTLGSPRKVLVGRDSHCKRCKALISKGVECYEIPHLGGTFSNYKRFCDDCFLSILKQTKADVEALFVKVSNRIIAGSE